MQPVHSDIRTLEALAGALGLHFHLYSIETNVLGAKFYFDPAGSEYRIVIDEPSYRRVMPDALIIERHSDLVSDSLTRPGTVTSSLRLWFPLSPNLPLCGDAYGNVVPTFVEELARFDNENAGILSGSLAPRAPRTAAKIRRAAYRLSPA